MRAVGLRSGASLGLAWACAFACSSPPPPAPAAVVNASPTSVCVNDSFHTQVHLDSRGSAPTLTLVYAKPDPDAGDLAYRWTFTGAVCTGVDDPPACDVKIDSASVNADGTITGTDVLLTMAGDRPAQVTLRVTNAAGGSTDTHATIAITPLDDASACPLPQASN